MLASLKNNNVEFDVNYREDFEFKTHKRELLQVLLNLIKNAKLSGILLSTLLANLTDDDMEKKMILDWLLEKSELSLLEINAFLRNKEIKKESLSDLGLVKIQKSIESFIHERTSHQCKQCGFHGKTLYWQCPSCHYWGTVVPVMPSLN